MDIVTHAMMGTVLAGPLLPAAPLTASCFILGSVLPDLDSISRCFGKLAFLRCHQTYTHGLPAIVAVGVAAYLLIPREFQEPWAPLALVAGLLLHVGLDLTNTYGTAILSPFSSRRFCVEWLFFIDAVVVTASSAALCVQWLPLGLKDHAAWITTAAYAVFLSGYWILRMALHRRARHLAPASTLSLIPSSLVPWRSFGCAKCSGGVMTFRLNALNGNVDRRQSHTVHDQTYDTILNTLPEFRLMRQLSPAYHVTSAKPLADCMTLICRDLRVRNFGGRFGELVVVVDGNGKILSRRFYV